MRSFLSAGRRRARAALAGLDSARPVQGVAVFALMLLLVVCFVPLQQNGDGLLLTVMSLQKLTVFFWEQDRFGNLGPLLTAWIRDPTANAYAQILLRLVCGLLAPLFFCSLVFRAPSQIWRATLLASLLVLIASGRWLMQEMFVEASPYGMSFACAGLAAMLLRAPRGTAGVVAGFALLVVAYVVNFGLITMALPLVGLLALLLPSAHRWRLAVLHGAAAAIGQLLPAIFAADFRTPMAAKASFETLLRFLVSIREGTDWHTAVAAILPAAIGAAVVLWRRPWLARRVWPVPAVLLGVAALNVTAISASSWVAMNNFNLRYFVPAHVLLMSVGGCALLGAVHVLLRGRAARGAAFLAMSVVLLLTAQNRLRGLRHGDRDIVIAAEAGIAHAVARASVAQSLDAIVGAHWEVWPAVFMTMQYRHDIEGRGGGGDVFGVALHGGVRARAFGARLAAGRMRIGCIDLAPADCANSVRQTMQTGPLRIASLAPTQPLPENHVLTLMELSND